MLFSDLLETYCKSRDEYNTAMATHGPRHASTIARRSRMEGALQKMDLMFDRLHRADKSLEEQIDTLSGRPP